MAESGFPWVQFDKDARKVFLHPGKGTTSQWAALGFNVGAEGQYPATADKKWGFMTLTKLDCGLARATSVS